LCRTDVPGVSYRRASTTRRSSGEILISAIRSPLDDRYFEISGLSIPNSGQLYTSVLGSSLLCPTLLAPGAFSSMLAEGADNDTQSVREGEPWGAGSPSYNHFGPTAWLCFVRCVPTSAYRVGPKGPTGAKRYQTSASVSTKN
jgi:hypothetical protein